MPLIELLLAVPMILWGGVLWTWFQTKSAAVRLWTVIGATALTFVPVVVVAVLDESVRAFMRGALN